METILGFYHVYFIIINSDVPLTRTAKELYNCMPFNIVKVLSSISSYMVHHCMLSVRVGWHHMAKLLAIIKN